MTEYTDSKNEIVYRYEFVKQNGKVLRYKIRICQEKLNRVNIPINPAHESWTKLEYNRCEHCTLSGKEHKHCPAALALSEMIEDWSDVTPTEEVHVHCRNSERKISTHTTVQNGLSTLMGLSLASSECPHFAFFKPMARFHLPVSTPTESYYRVLSNYFINRFFKGEMDISNAITDLMSVYEKLEVVNQNLSKRLYEMKNQHSTVSALVVLDLLAKMFSVYPEEALKDIQTMYQQS